MKLFGMLITCLMLIAMPVICSADYVAPYGYTLANGRATIISCDSSYTGELAITNMLGGCPVTAIAPLAFYGLSGLTKVVIPDSVVDIQFDSFNQCWMTDVVIGKNVANIGYRAFNQCYNLKNINIPNSTTNISYKAFRYCFSVPRAVIGSSVVTIGSNAFDYCSGLQKVYFTGNTPAPGASLFGDSSSATVYYMPDTIGWTNTYAGRSAVLWNPHANADSKFGVSTNGFGFTIAGTSNLEIVVQVCTNLGSPNWSDVKTNTLTSGSAYFSDSSWTNRPSRFYRFSAP